MSVGEAILAAIIAVPDEDVPRLMYADWLTENGQEERGEFVRVQCEIARTFKRGVAGKGVNAHKKIMARERQLMKRLWPGHVYQISPVLYIPMDLPWGELSVLDDCVHIHLRRGFPGACRATAVGWMRFADQILSAHPVEEATLTTRPHSFTIEGRFTLASGHAGYASQVEVPPGAKPDDFPIERILGLVWPSVKTWHLPLAQPRSLIGTTWDANGGESYQDYARRMQREAAFDDAVGGSRPGT